MIFDLKGPEFLMFYAVAGAIAFFLSFLIPYFFRQPGDVPMHTEPMEPCGLAYLNRGPKEAIRTALVSLYNRELITADGFMHSFDRTARPANVAELSSLERMVLSRIDAGDKHITKLLKMELPQEFVDDLARRDLALTPGQRLIMAAASLMPVMLLLGIGIVKAIIGITRDKPIGTLTMMTILTIMCLIKRAKHLPWTTLRGKRLIKKLKAEHSAYEFASRRPQSGRVWVNESLAMALFGAASLAFGSQVALAIEEPQPLRGTLEGGSCGGGGGGGGCGGGGCGGCGGD